MFVSKVLRKVQIQKKTRSTLPFDIPDTLRKEVVEFLAEPLTEIYNSCLREGYHPKVWKTELVSPVPKGKTNKTIKSLKDVRIIAALSDFCKNL